MDSFALNRRSGFSSRPIWRRVDVHVSAVNWNIPPYGPLTAAGFIPDSHIAIFFSLSLLTLYWELALSKSLSYDDLGIGVGVGSGDGVAVGSGVGVGVLVGVGVGVEVAVGNGVIVGVGETKKEMTRRDTGVLLRRKIKMANAAATKMAMI